MAAQVGSLFVSLTADVQPFAKAMSAAQRANAQATSAIRRDVGLTERAVGSAQKTFNTGFRPYAIIAASRSFSDLNDRTSLLRGSLLALTGIFGGFTAALSANVVLRYADSFQKLTNQIRVVSADSSDAAANMIAISRSAEASRSSIASTAQLFSRISFASPNMSPEKILGYVTTIQKALSLGGATTEEATSAAIQFSQAISAGRFQGQDLRAILETPLGLQLAKGLGVTTAELRKMGEQGTLTATEVLGALDKAKVEIDNKFNKSVLTLDQSFTQLDNSLTLAIGNFTGMYGLTHLLSAGIMGIAHNADAAVQAVAALGTVVATLFAGRVATGVAKGVASRVGAAIGAPGAISAVAQQNVGSLQAQLATEQAAVRAAQKQALAAKLARLNDPLSGATKSSISEYLRTQAALEAHDAKIVAANAAVAASYQRVAAAVNVSAKEQIAAQRAVIAAGVAANAANANDLKLRPSLVANVAAAKGRATAGGATALDIVGAEAMATAAAGKIQLAQTTSQLIEAEKATSRLGVAGTVLRNSWAGLLGLFGGPWGLAITALIAGAGILLEKLAASAEAARKADDLIQQSLERQGKAPGGGSPIVQQSIHDSRVKAATAELVIVKDQAKAAAAAVENLITVFSRTTATKNALSIDPAAFRALVEQFRTGALDAQQFRDKLTELEGRFANTPNGQRFTEEMVNTATVLKTAGASAVEMAQHLADIEANAGAAASSVELLKAATESFSDFISGKNLDPVAKKIRDLRQELAVAKATAAGGTAAGATQSALNDLANQGIDAASVGPTIAALIAEIKKINDAAAAAKKVNTEFERTAEIIDKIKQEAEGGFLGDIDREVIQKAKNIQNGAKLIRQYIDAMSAGDASKAPAELLDLRDALLEVGAQETWRGLLQQYGTAAQLTQKFADKQAELVILMQNTSMTAGQAGQAWADFVTSFSQYKWIDDVASAFGDFAQSAILDFNNIGDSALNFVKKLEQIAIQIIVIEPLVQSLRAAMAGGIGASNGGFLGSIASFVASAVTGAPASFGGGATGNPLTAGVWHAGKNSLGVRRQADASLFAFAPRFHKGRLAAGEMPAIIRQNEGVFTPEQQAAMGKGNGPTKVEIITPPGASVKKDQGSGPDVERYIISVVGNATLTGKLDGAHASRFGSRPRMTGRGGG